MKNTLNVYYVVKGMSDISDQQKRVINIMEIAIREPPEARHAIDQLHEFLSFSDERLSPVFINKFEELMERIHNEDYPHSAPYRIVHEIYDEIEEMELISHIPEITVEEDTNIVFLLGAGASYASDIPTVNGLLEKLLQQAKRFRRDDLEPLIDYCNSVEDINIEDVLTAAYLSNFATSDRHVVNLLDQFLFSQEGSTSDESLTANVTSVNFIQDTLQTLFGLLTSTMISKNPNPTHHAVRRFVENHGNTTIVTTNYDYCMDEELLNHDYGLESTIDDSALGDYDKSVELIKMHGSINWSYCESCQNVGNFDPREIKEFYEEDTISYPVIGICPECQGQRRPLLVPPISFKFLMFPPLIDIWYSARQALDEADYIIAVGYSFSDSDAYISKLISNAMTEQEDTTLLVANPDKEVTNELRERFSTDLGDFAKDRILGIHQKSEECIPDLVDEMLAESEDTAVEENTSEAESAADD